MVKIINNFKNYSCIKYEINTDNNKINSNKEEIKSSKIEKLEKLKNLINNGEYKIEIDKTVDKIIEILI